MSEHLSGIQFCSVSCLSLRSYQFAARFCYLSPQLIAHCLLSVIVEQVLPTVAYPVMNCQCLTVLLLKAPLLTVITEHDLLTIIIQLPETQPQC